MINPRLKNNIVYLIALLMTGYAVSGSAKWSELVGDYEFHYSAYSSNFLADKVARLYGIDRSKKLGVVVVSVIQKDSPGVGVPAQVSGAATNLIGQIKSLDFDEIKEGQAIYYVGTFKIVEEEYVTFKVDVKLAPTDWTHQLKWQQQF